MVILRRPIVTTVLNSSTIQSMVELAYRDVLPHFPVETQPAIRPPATVSVQFPPSLQVLHPNPTLDKGLLPVTNGLVDPSQLRKALDRFSVS